jgi:hypothetical protein
MPRDVKHGHRAFPEDACAARGRDGGHARDAGLALDGGPESPPNPPESALDGGPESPPNPPENGHDGGTAGRGVSRWFQALDPAAVPVPSPGGSRLGDVAAASARVAVFAAALLAFALVKSVMLRVLLPLALAVAALLLLRRGRSRSGAPEGLRMASPPGPSRGLVLAGLPGRRGASRGLELDGHALLFRSPRSQKQTLLAVDAAFGVTLLASPRRDRLIALLTSATGTYYLGASFDAASRRAFAPLLDRAFTVVGDDVGLEAIGPDGEPLLFTPEELASLLDALVERCTTCLDRFVLTDARGAPVTLDGRHLCVGDRAVDLNAPLEWKPIVFQEALGGAVAVFQGTWIRQSGAEMVLVSLLPALGPAVSPDVDAAQLDRAVLRDLRLMQASPEQPPPSDQRVAIERLFMLPVRCALDRAPRASRQPDRAQA